MQDYDGKVAVITGGASGIGLALAHRLSSAGAKILIADIEDSALERAGGELTDAGATVHTVRCDVSDRNAVMALADEAYDTFGAVHFLANNAGVVTRHDAWGSLDDWDWVLGIDLMGVVYGCHAFIPRMLEGGEPGHVMNTASVAGILAFPSIASYSVAKRGVVALSENLHHELAGTDIGVSVLCPGLVATRIGQSERNRPGHEEATPMGGGSPGTGQPEEISPEQLADRIVSDIADGVFWILPHPHYAEQALEQAQNRLSGGAPVMPQGLS